MPGSLPRMLIRIAVLLLVGATIGGFVGLIVTGDWIYTVVWAIAMPLAIVAGVLTAQVGAKARVEADPGGVAAASAPARVSRTAAIGVIVVGIALALIPSYRMIGWAAGNLAQGRFWDGNDMRTGIHQQDAVDDIARASGTYRFVDISFYDGYVVAEAPTSATSITTDRYEWRYGRIDSREPDSPAIEGAFDASDIDFSVVGRVVVAAKADLAWDSFEYVFPSVSKGESGEPEIRVSLGSPYFDATYTYTIAGVLIDRSGTGLD